MPGRQGHLPRRALPPICSKRKDHTGPHEAYTYAQFWRPTWSDDECVPLVERLHPDHPEHVPFGCAYGTCPSCEDFKFIGHGPLCGDCFVT